MCRIKIAVKVVFIIQENVSLKPYNTFGIDVKAKYYCEIHSLQDLTQFIHHETYLKLKNFLIIGQGSNILFTQDYQGIIVRMCMKGLRMYKEKNKHYFVKAEAGENWHDFVQWCIEKNYAGLENLSLIPGTVGAAPVQNIGAYGVEMKDYLIGVEIIQMRTGNRRFVHKTLLQLEYRNSIFKKRYKNDYIIVSVHFKLNKTPVINTSYTALKAELEKAGIHNPTIQDISRAVITIRQSKLPNPAEVGNAGSFFKNPVVEAEKLTQLKAKHPDIPHYESEEEPGKVKIAAGWLIDQCGWKGHREGDAGVHPKQALVLVNYGQATGKQILELAQKIKASVAEKFDIQLQEEVNII